MLKRLSLEESLDLLVHGQAGRLGCVIDNRPYVVPVNYAVAGGSIYIHSLMGLKIKALRANPDACLQVDEMLDAYQWKSVIAFGRYEEIEDSHERARAIRELMMKFPSLTPVESVPVHDGQSSVIVFAIRIEEITGVGAA